MLTLQTEMDTKTTYDFENKPVLGNGIYTAVDIAKILRIKESKVRRWINVYWDGEIGAQFGEKYSWNITGNRAVSFHTMVEFYIMLLFSEAGVQPKAVIKAHKELSHMFKTPFPFAKKEVLHNIQVSGKDIYIELNENIQQLNGTKQLAFRLIQQFYKNLEFDKDEIATRFWPLGKETAIVVDPSRKFGSPILAENNIYPETLYNHYLAGDPINYLAHIYEISEKEILDAIKFCEAA